MSSKPGKFTLWHTSQPEKPVDTSVGKAKGERNVSQKSGQANTRTQPLDCNSWRSFEILQFSWSPTVVKRNEIDSTMHPAETRRTQKTARNQSMEDRGISRPVQVFPEGRQRSIVDQPVGSDCILKSPLAFAQARWFKCALLSRLAGVDN